ncbi:MAG: TolB family protein [Planctomycetota bacterium JB042]
MFLDRASGPILVLLVSFAEPAAAQWTSAASIDGTGGLTPHWTGTPSISGDGRFVVFYADGPLLPADANAVRDVYLHDRVLRQTELVSVSLSGAAGNKGSFEGVVSADGRYVAFESDAKNLVAGDTNGVRDVFVRDRETATTTRVSVATGGGQANGGSFEPAISGDGRYVTFSSFADNLVPGDTNAVGDVFVHDRVTGKTKRVSLRTGGAQAQGGDSETSSISLDGRFVAFASRATNLAAQDTNGSPDVFLRDLVLDTTALVSHTPGGKVGNGISGWPTVSADGSTVVYQTIASDVLANDTNGRFDVVAHDVAAGTNTLVSRTSSGTPSDGHSYVIGVRQSVSANGRYVAFASKGTNLVATDGNGAGEDVFRHDRWFGTTKQVSISSAGATSNGACLSAAISADALHVAFQTSATNLAPPDTNGTTDIAVHSPWLNLSAAATELTPGQLLSLTTWRGTPGATLLYGISSIEGSPLFVSLSAGKFGPLETSTLLAPVPSLSGLSGLAIGFRAAAQLPDGTVGYTKEVVVTFH